MVDLGFNTFTLPSSTSIVPSVFSQYRFNGNWRSILSGTKQNEPEICFVCFITDLLALLYPPPIYNHIVDSRRAVAIMGPSQFVSLFDMSDLAVTKDRSEIKNGRKFILLLI